MMQAKIARRRIERCDLREGDLRRDVDFVRRRSTFDTEGCPLA
jgi:hypothetical protein